MWIFLRLAPSQGELDTGSMGRSSHWPIFISGLRHWGKGGRRHGAMTLDPFGNDQLQRACRCLWWPGPGNSEMWYQDRSLYYLTWLSCLTIYSFDTSVILLSTMVEGDRTRVVMVGGCVQEGRGSHYTQIPCGLRLVIIICDAGPTLNLLHTQEYTP